MAKLLVNPQAISVNLGRGVFEDVSEKANLGGEGLIGGPCTAFDFNNDGTVEQTGQGNSVAGNYSLGK